MYHIFIKNRRGSKIPLSSKVNAGFPTVNGADNLGDCPTETGEEAVDEDAIDVGVGGFIFNRTVGIAAMICSKVRWSWITKMLQLLQIVSPIFCTPQYKCKLHEHMKHLIWTSPRKHSKHGFDCRSPNLACDFLILKHLGHSTTFDVFNPGFGSIHE